MPDTNPQTSEATTIQSEISVTLDKAGVNLSEAKDLSPSETPSSVILSEEKDLSLLEASKDEDTLELDLALEEELIIEDFTIDGICGVY
jgi:mycofactocin precursor